MDVNKQFAALWKIGCRQGVFAIIKNKGRPLSPSQLERQVKQSVRRGLLAHAIVFARLAERELNPVEVERLTRRCLQLGWIPDALQAMRQHKVRTTIRDKVIMAAVERGIAGNPTEVRKLISCE